MFYDQTLCYGFGLLSWAKFLKLLCVFCVLLCCYLRKQLNAIEYWGKKDIERKMCT